MQEAADLHRTWQRCNKMQMRFSTGKQNAMHLRKYNPAVLHIFYWALSWLPHSQNHLEARTNRPRKSRFVKRVEWKLSIPKEKKTTNKPTNRRTVTEMRCTSLCGARILPQCQCSLCPPALQELNYQRTKAGWRAFKHPSESPASRRDNQGENKRVCEVRSGTEQVSREPLFPFSFNKETREHQTN